MYTFSNVAGWKLKMNTYTLCSWLPVACLFLTLFYCLRISYVYVMKNDHIHLLFPPFQAPQDLPLHVPFPTSCFLLLLITQ